MASSLALVGMASGIDTSSVIDQLLSADRARVAKMSWRQQAISTQQGHLRDVAGKLSTLLASVKTLSADASTWTRAQTFTSNDPTRVAVSQISGAGVGGHTVQVDRLASSAQRTYDYTPPAGDATLVLGPATLSIPAGTKLDDLVGKVNASADASVYAAAVDGRLVLSARTSGSTSDFTAGGTLALSEDVAAARTGDRLDALVRLDGEADARRVGSNTIDNLIPGLRVTLKGVTATPVSVAVSAPAVDEAALAGKVKAVVTAYNALIDKVRAVTGEKSVADPQSASQAAKGTLFGDTALNGMVAAVRQMLLENPYVVTPKAGDAAEGKSGRLTVDDEALAKAIGADLPQVRTAFSALAAKLEPLVKAQTGGTGGLVDVRIAGGDSQSRQLADQMTRANQRIDAQQKRLRTQFAAMEQALAGRQTQQAWLSGSINHLA